MTDLIKLLRHHATPDKVALIEACADRPKKTISYGELIAHAHALSRALQPLPGNGQPRLVAVLSDSPLRQAVTIIAGMASGMIVNAINPALSPAMLNGQLEHAQPDLLIIDDQADPPPQVPQATTVMCWGDVFGDHARTQPETDDALGKDNEGGLLIYTSGTTGTPKGILLPWSHVAANVTYAINALGMTPGWIAGSLLPRFHSFTLISDIFPALMLGGRAILVDSFELARVKSIVARFKQYRVQSYSAAPTILESFCTLRAWQDVDTLLFVVAGAAPLKNRTRIEYAALFEHPIIPCYGLTETTCFATISPPSGIRAAAVGLPAGIDIRVLGDSGDILPPDTAGELVMRGPSVVRGYFRDTAGRFAEAFTDDGWLRTGDIGRIDADGYVYVTGRKKNMVIRGGNKVYLEDVDRCIADYPGISDCASVVLCRPDVPDQALSFVVADGKAPPRSCINEHVTKHLTRRHVPDRIFFVKSILRTRTGKASIPDLLALAQQLEAQGETGK